MLDAVTYERDGHIGWIRLNRPDQNNAMTGELLDAFSAAVTAARADADARCVIITGSGRTFSAGADLKSQIQREGGAGLQPHERSYAMYEPFLSVRDIEVPVIGALNGHAVGGGFGLALMCDIRIACIKGKYGANFARLGLHSGMSISYVLPRLVGVSHASELLYTGRLIRGDEAVRIGLASQAHPIGEVVAAAVTLANEIAEAAPIAVRLMKRSMNRTLDWRVAEAAYDEAYAQAFTINTRDFVEGGAAQREKRAPTFEGR